MFILDTNDEVPKPFHADLTGAPMTNCVLCNCEFEEFTDYLIEKSFRRVNSGVVHTIFEYAICLDCVPEMQGRMSKESQENIKAYFESKVNIQQRFGTQFELNHFDAEKWIDHCLITNNPTDQCDEFQIYGQFKGNRMVFGAFPYAISGQVLDEMIGLLSAKSLDEMNGFKDQIISPDPTLKELFPTNRPPILI
jgi:hypothetical protein